MQAAPALLFQVCHCHVLFLVLDVAYNIASHITSAASAAAVKKFFYDPLGADKPFVDCVVSLTGFALVGGPARQDAPKAVEALTKLNVPYLVSLPLVFQTTEEWMDSELGVHPVQVRAVAQGSSRYITHSPVHAGLLPLLQFAFFGAG